MLRLSLTACLAYPMAAILLAGAACAGLKTKPPHAVGEADVLTVTTTPVPLNERDPGQQRVGALVYRGGLWLQSEDARFGGISGLRWVSATVDEAGTGTESVDRLLAITDAGDWLLIEPVEDTYRLMGIGAVHIGDLAGPDGMALQGKAAADAESLTLIESCGEASDGCVATRAIIGFERNHRLMVYDLLPGGVPGGEIADANLAMAFLKGQPVNGGVEAIAGSPPHLRIFSEELRDEDDRAAAMDLVCEDCDGWPDKETAFGVDMPSPFKPTDADWAPMGQLLLGRAFSALQGVAARIDMVAEGSNGAPPFGMLINLATLRPPQAVDNFEGRAVRVEEGRTFLYIVSDDNFSALQRTLLLKFEVKKD